MIAALYARKSTEQTVADEAKSVTRQIDHARAYAARKGWMVADAHVYVDDGISGAEFQKRPGYTRLLNSLKPRAPFQVLIVSELSRLGREQLETGYACKQLSQAGVRIVSYLEDREIVLESAVDVFQLAAVNFAAAVEQEKARQRAWDAALRRAKSGHVAGGRVFGYENVRLNGHVERRVVEAEAAIVRRIFELSVAGHGMKAIAKQLNADGAPSPRAQRGRSPTWVASSVREALHRDIYRASSSGIGRGSGTGGARITKRHGRRRIGSKCRRRRCRSCRGNCGTRCIGGSRPSDRFWPLRVAVRLGAHR